MTFGERLRKHRMDRGWTQAQVGELLGRTKNNISQFERGLREPDQHTLRLLATMFHTSIDELLGYEFGSNGERGEDWLLEPERGVTYLPVHDRPSLLKQSAVKARRPVPSELIGDLDYVYYTMSDDSMRGHRIMAGDLLLIRLSEHLPANRPSLLIADGEVLVRIVQRLGEQWILSSSDARFPPIALKADRVKHIGAVERVEFDPAFEGIQWHAMSY